VRQLWGIMSYGSEDGRGTPAMTGGGWAIQNRLPGKNNNQSILHRLVPVIFIVILNILNIRNIRNIRGQLSMGSEFDDS
jgi:hypothetical protein